MDKFPINTVGQGDFPTLLKEIPDPPARLHIRGTLPKTDVYLAVVGSRKYSRYGKDACQKLVEGLKGHSITIVSGLALGIDAIAHASALSAKLPTIAIPGSGLNWDVLYPAINTLLAERILLSGGALISEFDPDFKATPWSFPQRNRIMAGLCNATLVIEAANKSGTLVTARLATEYNRDVLAVPGSIFSESSYGPHMLIRAGAVPVTSSSDILDALGFKTERMKQKELFGNLNEKEREVLVLLENPMEKEELISKLDTKDVGILLSTMELKGLIKEKLGKYIKRPDLK